jgi:hypothetical protein
MGRGSSDKTDRRKPDRLVHNRVFGHLYSYELEFLSALATG